MIVRLARINIFRGNHTLAGVVPPEYMDKSFRWSVMSGSEILPKLHI